jgi:hypothetical protein
MLTYIFIPRVIGRLIMVRNLGNEAELDYSML